MNNITKILFYSRNYSVIQRLKKLKNISSKNFSTVTKPIILGIETSCDDTGIAIVDGSGKILGDAVHSQQVIHLRQDYFVCNYKLVLK